MPADQHSCPKCNAVMEPGLIVDVAGKGPLFESVVEPSWVALSQHEVERSTWPSGYIKNLAGRDRRAVVTYRCVSCDYLELYAGQPIQA